MSGWRAIETAPETPGPGGFIFCRVAWGPDEDKTTGDAIRWNGRWFASAVFHTFGDRRFELREIEVEPTHWMRVQGFDE